MTRQEARYRRVLRLLPAGYRQTWEDDMVDTFLMSARKVNVGETMSVLWLAIRVRMDSGPEWGRAVRPAVLATMLVQAAVMLADGSIAAVGAFAASERFSPLLLLALAVFLIHPAAYVVLLVGGRRTAAALVGAGVLLQVAGVVATQLANGAFAVESPLPRSFIWIGMLQVIGILVAFGSGRPPVARRSWLAALPVATVVTAAASFVPNTLFVLRDLWFAGLVIAAAVVLVRSASGPLRAALPGLLAMTALLVVMIGVEIAGLRILRPVGTGAADARFVAVEVAVLAVVGIGVLVQVFRAREGRVA